MTKPTSYPTHPTSPFALTEREEKYLMQSSIERVINTTISVLESIPNNILASPSLVERVDINSQDWIEAKEIVRKLWEERREDIFKRRASKQEDKRT